MYRNKLNWLLRKAERDHYQSLLENNKNNLKKSWTVLKEIINKQSSSSYPDSFDIDNVPTSDFNQIVNKFNQYFVNVGPNLASNIPQSNTSPDFYLKNRTSNSLFLKPVVEKEVKSVINQLKNSAAGYDSVCPSIVKAYIAPILKPLTHVFNLCINQGYSPDELKIAKVVPLFKKGNKKIITNYRPVSILPFFQKY